ncbi:MAG: glycosyltransferase involved in cell wall biosynthesis [Janthinobacterium sp.]|jgi:glycosyltransferase involved in cell wall biosynthesis
MRLSIIIPVLNESQALPVLLASLRPLLSQGCEVIMADGGSLDDTVDIARGAGLTLLHAARGRARQMNAGAARASGDVLLFLHADTGLPDGAVRLIAQALGRNGNDNDNGKHNPHNPHSTGNPPDTFCWGRFDVRIEGSAAMLPVIACMMNLRSRLTGIATGDQAMFVTRAAFDALGGFPDQPLMEDIALSSRLRAMSRPACIRRCVTTSGRRWETRGVWRTILLMWRLRFAYWRGVPAGELAKAYR